SSTSPFSQLPVQYADYAVWQRGWLKGEVLEAELSYWQEQLKGAPAVIELPTDHARPVQSSHRGSRLSLLLSRETSAGLRQLSREQSVTLFMTLWSAFAVLLWRYSGQKDLVIGTPIANRTRAELEGLIGFFVNTVA